MNLSPSFPLSFQDDTAESNHCPRALSYVAEMGGRRPRPLFTAQGLMLCWEFSPHSPCFMGSSVSQSCNLPEISAQSHLGSCLLLLSLSVASWRVTVSNKRQTDRMGHTRGMVSKE